MKNIIFNGNKCNVNVSLKTDDIVEAIKIFKDFIYSGDSTFTCTITNEEIKEDMPNCLDRDFPSDIEDPEEYLTKVSPEKSFIVSDKE